MTEYEEYKQTGMLASYQPERTLLRETDDGVQPVFRDTTYHYDEDAVIVERDMMVGQALLPCHLYLPRPANNYRHEEVAGLHRLKYREGKTVILSVDFGRALRYGVCTASACP